MYTRKPLPRGFPFFLFYEALEEKKMAKVCDSCISKKMADFKDMPPVPFAAYETALARSEIHNKRLWIVILVLIGALIASNLAWVVYESQFEDIVETEEYYDVEQNADGGGNNNSIINGGVVNGEAEDNIHKENNQNP